MDHLLNLWEWVWFVGLVAVAYIIIGLHFLSGDGIALVHIVQLPLLIFIALPSRLFLFLQSGQFLLIFNDIQIVCIVWLFLLLPLLLFFLLLLLLLVLFRPALLILIVRILHAVGTFIALRLFLIISYEIALIGIVILFLFLRWARLRLLYFVVILALPVIVLLCGVHDLIIINDIELMHLNWMA